MTTIQDDLTVIRKQIDAAAAACGRNSAEITLVGVSKKQSVEKMRQAIDAGLTDLGENYIQEAVDKIEAIGKPSACWHFIGHLQSNKARFAVQYFDLIHTVDKIKLAKEIDKQAKKIDKRQKILLQVNIAEEETKSGAGAGEVVELAQAVASGVNAEAMRHLSMGMSHDFAVAIQEGATLVRVGTAIFGSRS
jgi:pyridoxal phosphate enzyme (YggS family)